jgi:ribose 5-phosphate isomerase A
VDKQTALKKEVAERAVEFVESGMVVGLGHGSTAIWAARAIADKLKSGELHDILGVPCSVHIEKEALALGIPLTTLNDHPVVDLTIDGADEVDPQLELIKGGGGALLREKIVAQASKREIIIVDESKPSDKLGVQWAVPIEVIPFGSGSQIVYLQSLGAKPEVRLTETGETFYTDQGNLIVDCDFGPIDDPASLAEQIKARAGIVEHGLFIGIATDVLVSSENGIRHIQRDA